MPRTPSRAAATSVPDTAWAAVVKRGPAGSFVRSAAKTGVYCGPSCGARPKRKYVHFHATWADAVARACGHASAANFDLEQEA